MAEDSIDWRPLPLGSSRAVPILLVSAQVGVASYTIRLTDMANLWEESLDRKAICMRAWSENTTIDPSDTPENMSRFLASLTSALDARQPEHGNTSLALAAAAVADDDDTGDDGLTLMVTCALPGLAPLKWPLHLARSRPSAVATQLVLPLIEAHHARQREVESLLQVIDQKDSVLAKLLDKLEAMGIGLEHVFAALAGRKKVSRSDGEHRVRGIAPFDQRLWEVDMFHDKAGPCSADRLVQSVFGKSTLRYGNPVDMDASPALDRWWQDLRDAPQAAVCAQVQLATPSERTMSPSSSSRPTQDGDEFQVQATPPGPDRQAGKHKTNDGPPARQVLPATCEDGEESVIPDSNPAPAVSLSARQPEPESASLSGLDSLGEKRSPAPGGPHGSETRRQGEQRAEHSVDDLETASEASDNDAATISAPGSPSAQVAESTRSGVRKGGLGLIGGRAKNDKAETKPEGVAPTRKKIGVIGNKMGRGPPPAQDDDERGRGTAARVDEGDAGRATARETSQERADRRREELKRELQTKAAAGPARKKRRF